VALVAYSFGGLVLKSLVVEAHKHVYQRPINDLDDERQKCCKSFLNNVKGVVFYGVPHSGATKNLSKYFNWQCQQINTSNKYFAQHGFSRNLEPFNQQMESLSKEFKDAVHEDLNIYEFGEGLPVNENWVRFSLHHIEIYPTWFIS
jgi:triacylglycerol esterase/lipase EstA (alpha/beta hydrolase family)